MAFQMRVEPRVALAFFGDGAVNEGAFHEAANLAGLWKLPIIFFCENNLYGEGTPQSKQAPVADLSLRAAGYAFPGVIVDGNDVLAVYAATQSAVERARAGEGPTFIEGKTYRYRGHYEGDPMVYRSKEEIETWRKRDPIAGLGQQLIDNRVATAAELDDIRTQLQAVLDEAVQYAANSPQPAVESALEGVYFDTHGGGVF
jgi:pyruvate dehydrogenase E1 component alpha subunit